MRACMRWLLAAVLCVGVAQGEKAETLPKPTGYMNDYASATLPAVQVEIETVCDELHDKTKAQIFVVTVKTLEGVSIEEFANELFHKWKIGEKKTDRGVLMLYAIQDHKYRIEVGYGLEGLLPDAKVGDVGRLMLPQLKSEDYNNALETGLRPVAKAIADDAGVTLDSLKPPVADTDAPVGGGVPVEEKPIPRVPWWAKVALGVFGLLFGGALVAIVVATVRSTSDGTKPRRRSSSDADDDLRSGSSTSSSDSRSSSSSSSDSSSDSFSGGDGGDSGGGGASGSW